VSGVPDLKETIGDPTAILDSVYDFAKELIDLNKAFTHWILEVSQAATEKVTEKPAHKIASKA
jgi:ABC-type sulfate transport system substrate-binding protein